MLTEGAPVVRRGRGQPRKGEELKQQPKAILLSPRGNLAILSCFACGEGDEVDLNSLPRGRVFCMRCGGRALVTAVSPSREYCEFDGYGLPLPDEAESAVKATGLSAFSARAA